MINWLINFGPIFWMCAFFALVAVSIVLLLFAISLTSRMRRIERSALEYIVPQIIQKFEHSLKRELSFTNAGKKEKLIPAISCSYNADVDLFTATVHLTNPNNSEDVTELYLISHDITDYELEFNCIPYEKKMVNNMVSALKLFMEEHWTQPEEGKSKALAA